MNEPVIIDTNVLIALFNGDKDVARKLFESDRVMIPAVVCGEFDAGTLGTTKREVLSREAFEKLLGMPKVGVVAVTRRTGMFYAKVYDYCRKTGLPIPTNDIWIAASALETGMTILTNDKHLLQLPMVSISAI